MTDAPLEDAMTDPQPYRVPPGYALCVDCGDPNPALDLENGVCPTCSDGRAWTTNARATSVAPDLRAAAARDVVGRARDLSLAVLGEVAALRLAVEAYDRAALAAPEAGETIASHPFVAGDIPDRCAWRHPSGWPTCKAPEDSYSHHRSALVAPSQPSRDALDVERLARAIDSDPVRDVAVHYEPRRAAEAIAAEYARLTAAEETRDA